jgi:hypothetical protein
VNRRERTRHLIELGGLVVKSGLVELTNDDRAALYGAFLELVLQLQLETREQTITLWKRNGARAFGQQTATLDQHGWHGLSQAKSSF